MAVVLLFVDGVGVGSDDPEINPLARFGLPRIGDLAGVAGFTRTHVGGRLTPLDATLGVDGVPQSATGQATLLTGVNAAAALGRHLGPYPGAALRGLLSTGTLWHDARAAGAQATLANAYPERYLVRARAGAGRMGAFARSASLAGLRLRDAADLAAGRAVSAFITNDGWRDVLGYPEVPDATPEEAGENMARLGAAHDLTMFDFYATDVAGHRQDWEAAEKWLDVLDQFVAATFAGLSTADTLLLVSDHGNLEDLSTNHHTTNPALAVWLGRLPDGMLGDEAPTSLTDVAPAVRTLLGLGPKRDHA